MACLGADSDVPDPVCDDLARELEDGQISTARFYTVKPSELKVQRLLGSGAQADVFKALWTRSFASSTSSIVVAVKRMHADMDALYRDREALGILTDHPNLVKCFDATVDPPYLIVSEFCSGGSLFDLLYNSAYEMWIRQHAKILMDVAAGMKYLHNQKPCILHRDLKSGNVLLTKPIRMRQIEPHAKVADFGLSRCCPEGPNSGSAQEMTIGVGSWRWMAPELFESQEHHTSYDKRVDVFSFAMLTYEVNMRKMPYSDEFPNESHDPRIALYIRRGKRPALENLPEVFREYVTRAWDTDPDARPAFDELERCLQDLYATIPPPEVDLVSGGDGLFC